MSGARDLAALLARFPKTRPPLPPQLAAIYTRQYLENRSGETPAASLSQRLESWLHRQVAADVKGATMPGATLELGAGTLNQLAYEPASGAYDIVEPFEALFAQSPLVGGVRHTYADIRQAPTGQTYARVTSVASLEHICDLPFVLARAARLLAPGGSLRAAIPSEGGFLWKVGWMFTTGLEFRLRHGLDYGQLMVHEHVNDAREIETLVRALFEEVEVKSFGLGRQFSLYRFLVARKPRLDVAADWEARFG
ncbi:MAG TPA: class I SAM-dependent methyltransferase [Phenylobacterium sp.]|jgi:SAM-dependent methyltransferase|uniref:class I SAM-dependent methyltransferase n=1 Tax=Phenylobacterium sp. TaxID=1871053 RepID=UPI002D7352A3|nr:class I SAM-dependent methyltransferase [Phenylobacterium sp.]HZZ70074.1 class I SAM-dependent methyltransferase [Phenylobacterium sp.]